MAHPAMCVVVFMGLVCVQTQLCVWIGMYIIYLYYPLRIACAVIVYVGCVCV